MLPRDGCVAASGQRSRALGRALGRALAAARGALLLLLRRYQHLGEGGNGRVLTKFQW